MGGYQGLLNDQELFHQRILLRFHLSSHDNTFLAEIKIDLLLLILILIQNQLQVNMAVPEVLRTSKEIKLALNYEVYAVVDLMKIVRSLLEHL